MSVSQTQITVVGRLITDIDTRVTQTGHKVANFRIACQERTYDKAQDLWVDGDRLYMTISCWRAMADHVTDSLRKGDQVIVHGRLKIQDFTTKEGARRTGLEVDAKAIGPDLSFHTAAITRSDWTISPNQQQLLNSPPAQPTEEEPTLTRVDVAQAA